MPKSFIFYFGFLGLTNNGIISNRLYYTVGDMLMAKELNTITTSKEYVAFELAQNISRQGMVGINLRKNFVNIIWIYTLSV